MALISLVEITKQFDYKKILNGVDFTINEHERVAIVGKNGSGKSTLLKILNGSLEPDSGQINIKNNLKILTLEQNMTFKQGLTLKEVCLESLDELLGVHHRIQEIHSLLESNTKESDKELLAELGHLSGILDNADGWDLQKKVEEILVHFSLKDLENRIATTLSGGEQKRLSLATILLKPADIYILDEPTNHLDVEIIEFLEEKLLALKASVVFISHDRYFVDRVAHRIVEIDEGRAMSFDGGYASYLEQKSQMLANLTKSHETLLKLLKTEEAWLAKGVQARRKRNEGRKQRLMQLREDAKHNPALIRKMKLELERESKHFHRDEGKNTQKMIFECENLNKTLYGRHLICNLNLRILQKDRIAIVGKNGSGKSTLLKIILGEIPCDSGVIKKGELRIGYFDQHRVMLDDSKTLIETFCPNGGDYINVRGKHMHVFGYLKSFLFPKEMLDKKIGALSGGEKNRIALALLFTKEYDCLILDEPTNDLDIATINILEEYLLQFSGALIFVSHDRYFVDKLASKILIFGALDSSLKSNASNIQESYMSYSEYLDVQKELQEYSALELESTISKPAPPKAQIHTESKKPKKLSYKDELELKTLPSEIENLESKIQALELELSDPAIYQKRGINTIADELQATKQALESKYERYFEIEEKLVE